jgi:hypothetical protein
MEEVGRRTIGAERPKRPSRQANEPVERRRDARPRPNRPPAAEPPKFTQQTTGTPSPERIGRSRVAPQKIEPV